MEAPNLSTMARLMLSGQYTYLTYLIMSTTCFLLWLSPNWHKFRGIFKNKEKTIVYKKQLLNRNKQAI